MTLLKIINFASETDNAKILLSHKKHFLISVFNYLWVFWRFREPVNIYYQLWTVESVKFDVSCFLDLHSHESWTFTWTYSINYHHLNLLSVELTFYVSKRVVVVKQNCTHCFKTVSHFQRYYVRKCLRIAQHAQRTCTVGCSSIETTLTTFSQRSFSFILQHNPLLL